MSDLSPYVSNLDKSVFVLKNLPEETVATLFAKYSRSAKGLRETLAELLQETGATAPVVENEIGQVQASKFHEKYVLGYGHGSVAEHANLHLGCENVSILAAKMIEDNRLAAYTEKSTRYVVFQRGAWLPAPASLSHDSVAVERYNHTMTLLFDTYLDAVAKVQPLVAAKYPEAKPDIVRAKTCDMLRGLLPMGTLTNLGWTVNARSLQGALVKFLSSPLAEMQELGLAIKKETLAVVPTLLKYAEPSAYRQALPTRLVKWIAENLTFTPKVSEDRPVCLVESGALANLRLLCAVLYEATSEPYERIWEQVVSLTKNQQISLFDAYLAGRTDHEQAGRALESVDFTFEVVVDLGAWRDIQRHRITTQLTQPIDCELGYENPGEELHEFGVGDMYHSALERVGIFVSMMSADYPDEAQYMVPLAYRRRVLFKANLRELQHFIQLRSSKQGHPAYRRIAQQMYQEIEEKSALLARAIRCDMNNYALTR